MEQTSPPTGSVVVGVDGSPASDRALDWAVSQAVLERRPLAILHAVDLLGPGQAARPGASAIGPTEEIDVLTSSGREILRNASRRARHIDRALDLYEVLSLADPRNALLNESVRAATIVIGSRGRGPVSSLLLGSVGVAVSKHADCPVVVTRPHGPDETRGGVLVGVDGTALDRPVVEFAFRLAAGHALPLTVIHCFWDATNLGRDEHAVADDEPGFDDKRLLLRQAVGPLTDKFPDVHPHLELSRGFADQRLIERARLMDVVVVGSRRPGFPTLGFSSVAPTVVEHARCAVAVIPLSG